MQEQIQARLSALPVDRVKAFYAACGERMRLLYCGWCGDASDPGLYSTMVSECWKHDKERNLRQLLESSLASAPDEPDGFFDVAALGAIAAMHGALELEAHDDFGLPYENIAAAWQVFLYWELGDDPDASDFSLGYSKVPVVAQELQRQLKDLEELESAASVELIAKRARADALTLDHIDPVLIEQEIPEALRSTKALLSRGAESSV